MNRQSSWKRVGMMGLVLLLFLSLVGCEQNRQGGEEETEGTPESPSQTYSAGFVPQERTGIREQYLAISGNSFECTDTGVYFMCQDIQGKVFSLRGPWLGYAGETLRKAGLRPYGPGLQCLLFLNGNERLLL